MDPGLLEFRSDPSLKNALRQSLVSDIAVALAMALSYFAACWLGLSLDVTAGLSSVWPASGLLTGLLLVTPQERWRAIGAGALIGSVAANLAIGFTAIPSVGYTVINLGEAFAATLLIRRFARDAVRLRHPTDVISLITLCMCATAGGAVLAATLASVTMGAEFWTAFRTWFAADISGIITIGPVVLSIARRTDHARPWTASRVTEGALMMTILSAAAWWIFFSPNTPAHSSLAQPFPLLPFGVWAAIRFGVPGTSGLWSC